MRKRFNLYQRRRRASSIESLRLDEEMKVADTDARDVPKRASHVRGLWPTLGQRARPTPAPRAAATIGHPLASSAGMARLLRRAAEANRHSNH
jgi:hypothetical protein